MENAFLPLYLISISCNGQLAIDRLTVTEHEAAIPRVIVIRKRQLERRRIYNADVALYNIMRDYP